MVSKSKKETKVTKLQQVVIDLIKEIQDYKSILAHTETILNIQSVNIKSLEYKLSEHKIQIRDLWHELETLQDRGVNHESKT